MGIRVTATIAGAIGAVAAAVGIGRFGIHPGVSQAAGDVVLMIGKLPAATPGATATSGDVASFLSVTMEGARPGYSDTGGGFGDFMLVGGGVVVAPGRSATSGGSMSSSLYIVDYFSGGLLKQQSCANAITLATDIIAEGVAVNHLSGDVYISVSGGDIYRQAGGSGPFVAMGQTSRSWEAMDVNWGTGDVYACVPGDGIYRQAGGSGDFVRIFASALSWSGIAVDQRSGDVYACVDDANNGDIYRQAGGSGPFVALGVGAVRWNALACDPYTGRLFAAVYGGLVYHGDPVASGLIPVDVWGSGYWTGLAVNPDNGDLFASTYGDGLLYHLPQDLQGYNPPRSVTAMGEIAIG